MVSETPSDELQASNPGMSAPGDTDREEGSRSVSRRQIARLIGSAEHPVYVLDEQDIVVYINEAMSQLAGEFAEQFIGIDCSFTPDLFSSASSGSTLPPSIPPATVRTGGSGIELENWRELLAPPAIWDRTSVYADSWQDSFTRLLIPLDASGNDLKMTGVRSTSGRSTVLVVLAKGALAQLAEQIAFKSQSGVSEQILPCASGQQFLQTGNESRAGENPAPNSNAISVNDGGAAWFAAGNSLKAVAMRAQLLVSVQSSVSTVLVGPKCQALDGLASWIFQTRSRFNTSLEKNQRLQQIDCQLLDEKLLDDLFEVIDSMMSVSSDEVTLQLNRIDELPADLVLVFDRFLAGHPRLKFLSTSGCDLSQLSKRDPVWDRIRLRLEHLKVAIPPVVSRLEDMDAILTAWLHRDVAIEMKQIGQSKHYGAPNFAISKEAREALYAHTWPRSYEELAEVMREARKAAVGRQIEVADFPTSVRTSLSFTSVEPAIEPLDLDSLLESVERQLIEEAVLATNGNRSSAAKLLNISRARIIRRMQQWGMMPEPTSRSDSGLDDELDLPKFEEID